MAVPTASSGWKQTSPSASPQTKPTGRPRRSSPRAALLRMPPSRRARKMCNSASLIVPFRPSTNLSLNIAGCPIGVADQSVGQAAEIEQAVPIGVIAGQTRDLQAEHDTDMPQRDLRGEPGKATAFDNA